MKELASRVINFCAFKELLHEETKTLLKSLPNTWSDLYVKAINDAFSGKPTLLNRILNVMNLEPDLPNSVQFEDLIIDSDDNKMRVRLYTPRNKPIPQTLILYVHGGGWVLGGIGNSADFCAKLVEELNVCVMVPEYRLAPQWTYPLPINDIINTFNFINNNPIKNTDIKKIIFAGDSAGGYLSVVSILRLIKQNMHKKITAFLAFYPVVNLQENLKKTISQEKFNDGGMLTQKLLTRFNDSFIPEKSIVAHDDISLFNPDFSQFPKTFLHTAECDILRDEDECWGKHLKKSNCDVTFFRQAGTVHGYLTTPYCKTLKYELCQEIKKFLNL